MNSRKPRRNALLFSAQEMIGDLIRSIELIDCLIDALILIDLIDEMIDYLSDELVRLVCQI